MFERARYEWRRKRAIQAYDAALKKARAKNNHDEAESIHAEMGSELSDFDNEMYKWETKRLIRKARFYDIELPGTDDKTLWEETWGYIFLTAKGRTYMRTLIDTERNRRFEVKVRWLKLMTPIIAALAGLVGAATGFVLALKK